MRVDSRLRGTRDGLRQRDRRNRGPRLLHPKLLLHLGQEHPRLHLNLHLAHRRRLRLQVLLEADALCLLLIAATNIQAALSDARERVNVVVLPHGARAAKQGGELVHLPDLVAEVDDGGLGDLDLERLVLDGLGGSV